MPYIKKITCFFETEKDVLKYSNEAPPGIKKPFFLKIWYLSKSGDVRTVPTTAPAKSFCSTSAAYLFSYYRTAMKEPIIAIERCIIP